MASTVSGDMADSLDSTEAFISDLACECCHYKISRLKQEKDIVKQKQVRAEYDNESLKIDLKEKETDLTAMSNTLSKYKDNITNLLQRITYLEETIRICHTKEEIYQKELFEASKKSAASCNNINQIPENTFRLNRVEGENKSLRKELEIVKEEAQNAVKQCMEYFGEKQRLENDNHSLKLNFEKGQQNYEQQSILLASIKADLTETSSRELQLKKKQQQLMENEMKLATELVMCKADLIEANRQLEITREKVTSSQKKILNLENQLTKNQRKIALMEKKQEFEKENSDRILVKSFEPSHQWPNVSDAEAERLKDLLQNSREQYSELYKQTRGNSEELYRVKEENEDLKVQLKRLKDENQTMIQRQKKLDAELNSVKEENLMLTQKTDEYDNKIKQIMRKEELSLEAEKQAEEKQHLAREMKVKEEIWSSKEKAMKSEIETLNRKLLDNMTKLDDIKENFDTITKGTTDDWKMLLERLQVRVERYKGLVEFYRRMMEENNLDRVKEIANQTGYSAKLQLKSEMNEGLYKMRKILSSKRGSGSMKRCCCWKNKLLQKFDSLVKRQQDLLNYFTH